MNREILFRGQTRKRGEKVRLDGSPVDGNWVYGGVFQGRGDRSLIYAYENCQKYPVYSETVGQYTGLTDKNGVKIFEGDIARGKYGSTVYQNEVIFAGDGFALRHGYDQHGYCASLEEHDGLEVIGNIFDNPELLGENNT